MYSLPDFVGQYVHFSDDQWQTITSRFTTRHLPKDRFYLQPGQVNGEFVFIERGALRVFQTAPDGKDYTAWLAVGGRAFCDLASFREQRPTRFAVQALTDTDMLVISHADMEHLYQTLPGWQEFSRKLWEDVSVNLINTIVSFQAETAEARYERLSRERTLLQSAPLKYIAEFLGMTPHTLSRLRGKR